MFPLDFTLSVFLVTHIETKLTAERIGGNRGRENGVVHWLVG